MKIIALTHDLLGDPFWMSLVAGLNDAARNLGVTVEHRRLVRFESGLMISLMEQAIADKPDALVTTLPQPDLQDAAMRQAAARGIPVVVMNTIDPRPIRERPPCLSVIAADDCEGGTRAAAELLEIGCQRALCLDHYRTRNVCHTLRAQGFVDEMKAHGHHAEVKHVDAEEPDAVEKVAEILPRFDALLTLGPPGNDIALKAKLLTGCQVPEVTFDVSLGSLDQMESGNLAGLIDCQQYLQGYYSINFAVDHIRWGFTPPKFLSTGPILRRPDEIAMLRSRLRSGKG